TRQWVIIATERARRPDEFRQPEKARSHRLPYVPTCPFCPGNEEQTPPESFRIARPEASGGGWQVRVVPNKFAALESAGALARTSVGLKRTITGVGIHEVIVETPDHSTTLALMREQEMEQVIHTYLGRYHAVAGDARVEAVTLFKNHGPAAGTSLEHTHSQLIGTPVIPTEVRERLETALRFYDDTGRCIFCATLEEERAEGKRVVAENEHFVAFVPFGAPTPFHLWIYPKRHCASFGRIEPAEIARLAHILRRVLRKLYAGLADPDYNFVIRTAPKESEQVRYYHWYLSVVPRLTQTAGFEMGSGMFINVAQPEASAQFLRNIAVD
ncbi:MAG: galactose-1-phosphate uridylyltransferase, partial [Terriglobia bacterium]